MGPAAKAWRAAEYDPSEFIHSLQYEISRLESELNATRRERDQWKANHDNQVRPKAAITDEPGDRVKRVRELTKHVARSETDTPRTEASCVDMLGRDAVADDMMWDTLACRLFRRGENPTAVKKYFDSVRCPRPGEEIPDFKGWQDMCLAMQEAGAVFECDTYRETMLKFICSRGSYQRSSECKWKM